MDKEPVGSKKIRKGDKVLVMSGNDRGQSGNVLKVMGDKAVVQGINIRKKHVKRSQTNPQGAIVELEKPVHISNLRICTDDNQPIKLKVRVDDKGNRAFYYKLNGQEVLYRTIKK